MFLQLCDMSDAVLDTCEGDFQGKLAPAHLALHLLAGPASRLATTPPTSPSPHCMWLRPTNSMPTSLTGVPQPQRAPWLRSLWLSELTGLSFLSFHQELGRHPAEGSRPFFPPSHHHSRSPFLRLTVCPVNRPAVIAPEVSVPRDCSLHSFAEGHVPKNTHQVKSGTGPQVCTG